MNSIGAYAGFAFIMGLVGLAILIVLWPGERQGKRVLAGWGIKDPSHDEVTAAVQYLRRRRFWYPWLYLLLPAVPRLFGSELPDLSFMGTIFVILLAGGLVAELLAQRSARGPRREAVLETRGVLDFVPAWALVLGAVTELAAVANLAFAASWPRLWLALVLLLASWVIVLLAVRRPSAGTDRVDLALRCRSARVALGLGIGSAAGLAWTVGDFTSFLAFAVSLIAFSAIASPPGKLPTTARTA